MLSYIMTKFFNSEKVFLLAEVAQSYEGSLEVALDTASKLIDAGADAIMFQIVHADELATPQNNGYELFKKIELSEKNWKSIVDLVHEKQGKIFAEIFGCETAALALRIGVDGFKIHTADLANFRLLEFIGKTKIPLLLSVGGSHEEEIEEALNILKLCGRSLTEDFILLHGYQRCPTEIKDTHLSKILALKERFQVAVGYSDHVAGCLLGDIKNRHPHSYLLPILSLGTGICLIEKHAMLNRTKAWEDHESALTPKEFEEFVKLVRELEQALGTQSLEMNEAEKAYRVTAKKHIVAKQNLEQGTKLTKDCLEFKRIENPKEGVINPQEVLGQILKVTLPKDHPIKREHLE